ncbi:MAG: hypothetical protein JZU52_19225 [Lamprocystis purpurea]|nr:hypothetical protein [Lamprocystis purpurea]
MGGESDETLASTEISREHIVADRKTSVGLASLEWRALRSLQPPNGLTREGYLVVLLALRGHRAT